MALLELKGLDAFYGKARSLHGVSLQVDEGAIVAVIGPVGAGKSTLLDSILGLTETTGQILFEEQDLKSYSSARIVGMGIGYATERGNLFPYMSVKENLLVGAYRTRARIVENLRMVFELFPRLKDRQSQDTNTLSGGERQMVSLGRALMSSPKMLLVDEPTIGLSPKVCLDIAAALRKLNDETGVTIVIAEQNVNFALSLAEEIYLLETGTIVRKGTPAELQNDERIKATYFGG